MIKVDIFITFGFLLSNFIIMKYTHANHICETVDLIWNNYSLNQTQFITDEACSNTFNSQLPSSTLVGNFRRILSTIIQ